MLCKKCTFQVAQGKETMAVTEEGDAFREGGSRVRVVGAERGDMHSARASNCQYHHHLSSSPQHKPWTAQPEHGPLCSRWVRVFNSRTRQDKWARATGRSFHSSLLSQRRLIAGKRTYKRAGRTALADRLLDQHRAQRDLIIRSSGWWFWSNRGSDD